MRRLRRGDFYVDKGRALSALCPMEAQTKYAKSGDVHIAYRVFGEGSKDIVLIPGTLSHVELLWEWPVQEYLLKRLTSFARVIVFDKRGQGLSDRVAEQTLDERIGDVRAVMDAAGSKCATIYGWSEGGPMALMFAATYPERTSALVLYGTLASIKPVFGTPEQLEQTLAELSAHWGEGRLVAMNAPSQARNESFVRAIGRLERASASPASIVALFRANYEIDVRHILPSMHLPTLILHRKRDALVKVEEGRYLAEHIPGARYVEIPGEDHTVTDLDTQDVIADEIEEFITGAHYRPEPDSVLATVMFTDIVASTERAAELGDRQWRGLLDNYYAAVRKELNAFRGREVKTAGDGVLATFDGPARAIRSACSLREKVRSLGLEIRSGLHTGECELMGDDVRGIAVHIAARVATTAASGEILVSSTVKDLVAGSGLRFADKGMHNLKGVPGEWRLYTVQ
jgi:class 3 adenylate cyclase